VKRLPALGLLALAWMAIGGSLTLPNLVLGLAVAVLALHLAGASGRMPRIRPFAVLALALLFLKELARSVATVLRTVLKRRLDVRPGLVEIPLTLDRDGEISLLACLVTLTPGTLSVDLSEDRRTLLVHALDASDPAGLRRGIAEGFERGIKKAFP
jgi:multicomponent Na+:H+ antiporter subunit E